MTVDRSPEWFEREFVKGLPACLSPGSGLDVGSRSIELVLLEGGQVVRQARLPTTFDPLAQCRRLLEGLPPARIVATGYGRKLLVENLRHHRVTAITEIQAYALGAHSS